MNKEYNYNGDKTKKDCIQNLKQLKKEIASTPATNTN